MLVFLLISLPLLLPANVGVSGVCTDAQQKAFLDVTNGFRAKHGVSALKTDPQIIKTAQAWADGQAANGTANSSNGKYSEILWAGDKLEGALESLYRDELPKYTSYGAEPKNPEPTKHFTQLVWKSTSLVGCGCADYTKGKIKKILVCNYYPLGNLKGEYAANVLSPK